MGKNVPIRFSATIKNTVLTIEGCCKRSLNDTTFKKMLKKNYIKYINRTG